MIIGTAELSPDQKTTLEGLLGKTLGDKDAVSLRALPDEKSPEQRAAAEGLIKFLEARRKLRPEVSDEDLESSMLEAIRSERPNFRPMP
jgi:hypothetical protein